MDFTRIKEILAPYDNGKCPGCAVVATHKGETIFTYTSGYSDLENDILVTEMTNFRLASVTKQFTATAILILIQQSKLCLDDALSKFFPNFPEYGKNITIYQLLVHTSGLIDYEDLMLPGDTTQIHDEGVLALLTEQEKGYFAPGTQHRYSNGGYCLLRLVIEIASEKTFSDFMKEEIFAPLEMNESIINVEGKTSIHNRAFGYSYNNTPVATRTDQDATSATIGDGGIYSSLNDMSKWDRVFYTDKILSKKLRDAMFTEHVLTAKENGSSYGFGVFIKTHNGKKVIYHGGGSIGFKTGIYTIPEKELTVVFLSNRSGGSGSKTSEMIAGSILKQM